MMNKAQKAIEFAMKEFRKEFGKDAKFEDGDEFATVFKDGVLIIGLEDEELKIKFILGKPYKVNYTIGLTE